MVSIIGPSGAGKSTLLRMVNRLVEPTAGRVLWNDRDVTALRGPALHQWRGECAMVFQQFNLAPRLDALTNVLLGRLAAVPGWRALTGAFRRADRLEAMELLDEFGLSDRAFQRAERLSGGQRVILADEPTASLDPRNAEQVMDALRAINRGRGITVLCNLHNVGLARAHSDRIIALRSGRVVFDGRPGAVAGELVEQLYRGGPGEEAVEAAAPMRLPEPV